MHIIYTDESGDIGLKSEGSPTNAYTLAALTVNDSDWLATLDQIVRFRRFLKRDFRIRLRDELKAGYLIHGTGPMEGISDSSRMKIYKMALRLQEKLGTIKTWAIVIDKVKYGDRGSKEDIHDRVWEYMIQRIERYTTKSGESAIIYPDEGNNDFVRKKFRRMRRFSFVWSHYEAGVTLSRPATFIIEDPSFRHSQLSYFIQLADLNAYAAYRRIFPESYFGAKYWDYLGSARLEEVNKTRGGPTGIVVWP